MARDSCTDPLSTARDQAPLSLTLAAFALAALVVGFALPVLGEEIAEPSVSPDSVERVGMSNGDPLPGPELTGLDSEGNPLLPESADAELGGSDSPKAGGI
ncbi:MAG TPA: hypothetical protein EYQ66_00690, partial [Myxococcales bacterium]|nr:hypothetical protein [Myxococcales bacterium]